MLGSTCFISTQLDPILTTVFLKKKPWNLHRLFRKKMFVGVRFNIHFCGWGFQVFCCGKKRRGFSMVEFSQENRELEEMKAELLKRSHELVETQRSLRKLQEALPAPEFPELCWRFLMEALEEKKHGECVNECMKCRKVKYGQKLITKKSIYLSLRFPCSVVDCWRVWLLYPFWWTNQTTCTKMYKVKQRLYARTSSLKVLAREERMSHAGSYKMSSIIIQYISVEVLGNTKDDLIILRE